MAKEKFVVLATNTNHDDTVYGPFDSEDDAREAKAELAEDHLHEFHILPLTKPED